MLFRFSISVIILLILHLVDAFAGQWDDLLPKRETLLEVEKNYSRLRKGRNVEKFKKLTQSRDITEFERFIDSFNLDKLSKDWWLKAYKRTENREKEFLFYLFSSSVPDETVRNVLSQRYLIPPEIGFYPVLRGIPSIDYLKKMKEWKELAGVKVKINPIIFKKAGVEVVPAFVLAKCKVIGGILRSKTCVFQKVLYGDVSLQFALEKFGCK